MSISMFFVTMLAIWIWILQGKISDLERLVRRSLKDQKPVSARDEIDDTTIEKNVMGEDLIGEEWRVQKEVPEEVQRAKEVTTATETFDNTVQTKVEEPVSNVEAFEQSHVQPKPQEPSMLMTYITNYFTGGNILVRVGGVILFIGLAFLVKFAAENTVISMSMRLWGIAIVAVALIIVGWRLRNREDAYGQILQGLGVAMLYLVIYGAAKFYTLLPLDVAFMLMLGVVLLGSVLAVIEDALPLALFATAGGFLVPILTSSGQGSHVLLFSYYAFLNVGIFIVAWYRSWRILNVVGFIFTFVIATAWGALRYQAEYFATTEPFLVLYFVMYLIISILFTLKHPFKPKNFVDSTLVFGLPVVAFSLQLILVKDIAYGDAKSAVTLGVVYLGLWLWLRNKERTGLLAQSFLALSVVFFTIAIPYIFDADVSAALWSLEGTAAIWVALKQGRILTRYFGALLLTVSIFVYPDTAYHFGISLPEYLGFLVIIIASILASYLLDTHKQKLPALDLFFAKLLLGVGIVFWFVTADILHLVYQFYDYQEYILTLIVGASLLFIVARRTRWKLLADTLQGTLPLGLLLFLGQPNNTGLWQFHPFAHLGAMLFAGLFLLHFIMLYSYRGKWHFEKFLHVFGLWFIVLLLSVEVHYRTFTSGADEIFSYLTLAIVPLLASLVLLPPKRYKGWLETYRHTYQFIGVGALVFVLFIWELSGLMLVTQNLGTVPVFNLLDMMQIFVLALIAYWVYHEKAQMEAETLSVLYGVVALTALVLVTVIFARWVHYTQDIAYTRFTLWHSLYFQTGVSLLWSVMAIVLMLFSKRYANRVLWMAGFGLLIIVVLKLFFVELANSGTIERIISFMVVGTLLLLIGYFVPLPPDKTQNES